tara:strand:- start:151 stop:516 length:366 start_codon:yes stop_codon:yes gene_type:complete
MLRTGIDLIEIKRIDNLIVRHRERFLNRVYTQQEIIDSMGKTPSLAVRIAAKEAVSKVLGCGIGPISWKDVEILKNEHNMPYVNLMGNAQILANDLSLNKWSVSLTHSTDHAGAIVVAISS